MSDVYVYALLGEAPHPDAGAGLCAEPLRVVRVGDLVAAVGEMAERPPVSEATLRAHDAVIRRLAGAVDAILPAPPPDDLGPGARYLAARRAEWRRAREAPELEPLRPWLEPLVRAERVTRHDTPPLIASVYHLIDRGAGAAYLAAVERVALAAARVVATGPWPPYAFAPEALG